MSFSLLQMLFDELNQFLIMRHHNRDDESMLNLYHFDFLLIQLLSKYKQEYE
jgi:hypothetical protein